MNKVTQPGGSPMDEHVLVIPGTVAHMPDTWINFIMHMHDRTSGLSDSIKQDMELMLASYDAVFERVVDNPNIWYRIHFRNTAGYMAWCLTYT